MKEKDYFQIELLDPYLLIKKNNLQEISNPVYFNSSGLPTSKGLLSNDIFGISKDDRANIFAYIDLEGTYFHPVAYKMLVSLDRKIEKIVSGTNTYKINSKGEIVEDENGETGIDFLIENFDKIKFKKTDSRKRDDKIKFIKDNREYLFIKHCIVIPAYYRDVNTEGDRVGVGEINKLYNNVIRGIVSVRDMGDYGLSISHTMKARIQNQLLEIYRWFTHNKQEESSGLYGKYGKLRQGVLNKTTDFSSRMVLSSPNIDYEHYSDMVVDVDHSLIPLSAALANLYPFVVFRLRRFFDEEFGSDFYLYRSKDSDKDQKIEIDNPKLNFSDDVIKKEINNFIRGFSNRLKPILIPNKENKKLYLKFHARRLPKGFEIKGSEKVVKDDTPASIILRNMTWCDLFYMACYEEAKNKVVMDTRYPVESAHSVSPTKPIIGSTKKTVDVIIKGKEYKRYPDIKQEDIGSNTSDMFIDTFQMSNLLIGKKGGDYDGDMVSTKILFTEEANAELLGHLNSLKYHTRLDGTNAHYSSNEAVQALFSFTNTKNKDSLTPTSSIKFK